MTAFWSRQEMKRKMTFPGLLTSSAPVVGVTANLGSGANFTTSAKDTFVSARSPAMRITILINAKSKMRDVPWLPGKLILYIDLPCSGQHSGLKDKWRKILHSNAVGSRDSVIEVFANHSIRTLENRQAAETLLNNISNYLWLQQYSKQQWKYVEAKDSRTKCDPKKRKWKQCQENLLQVIKHIDI